MKNAKISIVTICYNADNLERTCESIVTQDRNDFEWVVIDGGSSDEHQKIFDKYKSRMDYFVSEPDKGIYDAMNKGILASTGEYVIFMNAGDSFYDTNILSHVMRFMETDDSDIIFGISMCTNEYRPDKRFHRVFDVKMNYLFWFRECCPHQAMFYKRNLFDTHGMYRKDYKILGDVAKNIELYRAGVKFKYMEKVIAKFDTSGISAHKSSPRFLAEKSLIQFEFFPELLSRFNIYHMKFSKIWFQFLRICFCFNKQYRNAYKIRYKNLRLLLTYKKHTDDAEFYRVLKEYPHILNPR